jgi:regulator of replication initiation timing
MTEEETRMAVKAELLRCIAEVAERAFPGNTERVLQVRDISTALFATMEDHRVLKAKKQKLQERLVEVNRQVEELQAECNRLSAESEKAKTQEERDKLRTFLRARTRTRTAIDHVLVLSLYVNLFVEYVCDESRDLATYR